MKTTVKKTPLNQSVEEKLTAELLIADREIAFQGKEKKKRAAELIIANKELVFQGKEKGKSTTFYFDLPYVKNATNI